MLHPSYSDLMKTVNSGVEEGETPVVNSRYSIVMATSKRARQIIAGAQPLVGGASGKKPLSIAVEELAEEKIHILAESEEEDDETAAACPTEEEAQEAVEETVAAEETAE